MKTSAGTVAYFPNLRSILFWFLLWPSIRSTQFRNWRRCFGDARCERNGCAWQQLACVTARQGYGTLALSSKMQRSPMIDGWFYVTVHTFDGRCHVLIENVVVARKGIGESSKPTVPYETVLARAFVLINSRNDVAKAIGVKPATFFRWRFFAADGNATHDSVFMHDLAETFEVEPPWSLAQCSGYEGNDVFASEELRKDRCYAFRMELCCVATSFPVGASIAH